MTGMANITESQYFTKKKMRNKEDNQDVSSEYEKEEEEKEKTTTQEKEKEVLKRSPLIGSKCRGLGVALNPSTHGTCFNGGIDLEKASEEKQPILYYADASDEVMVFSFFPRIL